MDLTASICWRNHKFLFIARALDYVSYQFIVLYWFEGEKLFVIQIKRNYNDIREDPQIMRACNGND